MGIRRQFVLDKKTDRTIRSLAEEGYGSRSRVVREAVAALAEREAMFEKVESNPGFIKMMERADEDVRAGRLIPQEEIERELERETRLARRKAGRKGRR